MQFLKQEVPDPPADCANATGCTFNVRVLEIFAATMTATTGEVTPGTVDLTAPTAEETAVRARAAGLMNVLPQTMERLMPAANRCGEACVINCALRVLRDGGKV